MTVGEEIDRIPYVFPAKAGIQNNLYRFRLTGRNDDCFMLEKEFPILKRKINGHKLVYLDNAATTQKPRIVIDAITDYYKTYNANIHRGLHTLAQEATDQYEKVRDKVQKFINAKHREEIVFTRGATEAINLVAWTWGYENIKRGDEILLSEMEHHSNIVPWQLLAKKKGAKLKFIPISTNYQLSATNFTKLITKKTKIISIAHISNVLGTINPVKNIIKKAHTRGAKVLIDGAQAGAHEKIDVQKLDTDFYILSGHKMYGPTGVGVLYGKKNMLDAIPPYQTGGGMISRVRQKKTDFAQAPYKFEAGTPPIAQVVGLGAAIDFVNSVGHKRIKKHESEIMKYAYKQLKKVPQISIYGPTDTKIRRALIAFTIEGIPAHDLATILDGFGVAIRAGHHCTMILHETLGIDASARISCALYNTKKDIDQLVNAIQYAQKTFGIQ